MTLLHICQFRYDNRLCGDESGDCPARGTMNLSGEIICRGDPADFPDPADYGLEPDDPGYLESLEELRDQALNTL